MSEEIWEGGLEDREYVSVVSDNHNLDILVHGRTELEIPLDSLVGRLIFEMAKYKITVECQDCGEIEPPLYCNNCASNRYW